MNVVILINPTFYNNNYIDRYINSIHIYGYMNKKKHVAVIKSTRIGLLKQFFLNICCCINLKIKTHFF